VATDPIHADFSTFADLKRQLGDLANALDNSTEPLGRSHDDLIEGAGQFSGRLAHGAAGFLLSWEVALRSMSDGAALVANNVEKSSVDLSATDADFAGDIQL
jgi:hypothetical protein